MGVTAEKLAGGSGGRSPLRTSLYYEVGTGALMRMGVIGSLGRTGTKEGLQKQEQGSAVVLVLRCI